MQIGTPTHIDNLREQINHVWSAGTVDGGDITDNGDGTVSFTEATAALRASASSHVDIYSAIVPAQVNLAMTDGTTNYVYVDYNGGSPVWVRGGAITDFNCQDKCLGYVIVREGTSLDILDSREQNVDSNRIAYKRRHLKSRYIRLCTTENQRVNIMGAFIGIHHFQVHHMAHDRVLVGNAVGPKHIPCLPGDVQSLTAGIALDQGNQLRRDLSGIHQLTRPVAAL